MELKWLLDFVSLANSGNFSRSAEERNVTQSAFSRRIQSLENWLGAELVDRTSHPVSLTDAGIRFLKPAKNMIMMADRIREDFGSTRNAARESLTFSSATNLAVAFLPGWLVDIQKDFGEFGIRVLTDICGVHDHFEALRTKQSDFLLHYGHGIDLLAVDGARFEHLVVGHDRLLLVGERKYLASVGTRAGAGKRRTVAYISPWKTSLVANQIAEMARDVDPTLVLDTRVESSIIACSKAFVAAGQGAAWLPRSVIEEELTSGRFVPVIDGGQEIPLSIELYRYASGGSRLAARFWETMRERYEMPAEPHVRVSMSRSG